MGINPDSGEVITLAEAQKYVQAFRIEYPSQPKAFFVGIKNVEKILEQADCIGIRIYNGYDDVAKRPNLVLVGVNSNEKDMTDGVIVEKLTPCPSECDPTSGLY